MDDIQLKVLQEIKDMMEKRIGSKLNPKKEEEPSLEVKIEAEPLSMEKEEKEPLELSSEDDLSPEDLEKIKALYESLQ